MLLKGAVIKNRRAMLAESDTVFQLPNLELTASEERFFFPENMDNGTSNFSKN